MSSRSKSGIGKRVTAAVLAVATIAGIGNHLVTSASASGPSAKSFTTSTVIAADAFNRNASGNTPAVLGSADVGGVYSAAFASHTSVGIGGSKATFTGVRKGETATAYLMSPSASDVQIQSSIEPGDVSKSRLGLYYTTDARIQPNKDRYTMAAIVYPDGKINMSFASVASNQVTRLGYKGAVTKIASNQKLDVQFRVVGSGPVTLMGRAWIDGTTMPDWQYSVTDGRAIAITASGGVGFDAYLSTLGVEQPFSISGLTAWKLAAPVPPTTTTTKAPITTTTQAPIAQPAGFVHPGIVDSRSQLDFVKARIAAGQEPWTSALATAKYSRYGKLTWQAKPVAVVMCGPYSKPDIGCTNETDDAQAAYTDALIYSYTGDKAYAAKSIEILNAWSAVLQEHAFSSNQYNNGKLQAGWAGEVFTKAAEVVRYSGAGWSDADIARFEKMLTTVFLPEVQDGWAWGNPNWNLSMAEATMNIGIFTNNRAAFNDGVDDWRKQIHDSIYLTSDGPSPKIPAKVVYTDVNKYWNYTTAYVNGEEAETCRDLGHTTMGLAAAFNAAESASIQGVNLYGEEQTRLTAAMEYNIGFINNPSAAGWVCPNPPVAGGSAGKLSYEIAYSHYTKAGVALPETKKLLQANRPSGSGLHMNWETLTHGVPLN